MTRDFALKEIEKPVYDKESMDKDLEEVLSKLDLTREEFDKIVFRPGKQHTEYKTDKLFYLFTYLLAIIKKIL